MCICGVVLAQRRQAKNCEDILRINVSTKELQVGLLHLLSVDRYAFCSYADNKPQHK